MYVPVYAGGVRRTNIYLSEEEQAALAARAAVEGSNRSDVLRSIVDRELHLSNTDNAVDAIDAALADAADEIAAAARALVVGDADLGSG